jgi:hypothetical protein
MGREPHPYFNTAAWAAIRDTPPENWDEVRA